MPLKAKYEGQTSPTSFSSHAHIMSDTSLAKREELGISTVPNDYAFFKTPKFKICFFSMWYVRLVGIVQPARR